MTIIQLYKNKVAAAEIRSNLEAFLTAKINANQDVFEALSRMGNHYGGNVFPVKHGAADEASSATRAARVAAPTEVAKDEPLEIVENRYSVVYLFHERHQHVGCSTQERARAILASLSTDPDRIPVGIYDARTELFEWDTSLRPDFDQSDSREQNYRTSEVISIAQALRRRDSTWESYEFRRPSVFS